MYKMALTDLAESTNQVGHWNRWIGLIAALGIVGTLTLGCRTQPDAEPAETSAQEVQTVVEDQTEPAAPPETPQPPQAEPGADWDLKPSQEVSLFDGKTLGQWKATDFGGQGDVYVKDGAIFLEMGSYATGITWNGPVVRMDYEISLDAKRVDGSDFFCALTFPAGENPCTLVLGGWGGTLCGLSNLDYYDASENETTTFYAFEKDTWYHVRLRVESDRIQAWLDGEGLIDVDITGRKIDIRAEMDLCQPLGIATWVTTGAVRNIRLRKLPSAAY